MATIVPESREKKISFFTALLPRWAEDPAAIGTTAERVALVQADLDEARAADLAQRQAISAARAATSRLKIALAKLGESSAQVISEIKTRAAIDGDAIYGRALLPRPAKPSPIGSPGKASSLSVELMSGDGSLRLSWKCRHPRGAKGTMYQVYRALSASDEYAFLGATGKKKFIDATIPAGTARVIYRIVAIRSTRRGQPADFPVNLGVNPAWAKLQARIFIPRSAAA